MTAQAARHRLPAVIRPGHPEDGNAYVITTSGREYGREYSLTDAHGVAMSRSRLGATCTVEHEQANGTWVTVATYRYGKVA